MSEPAKTTNPYQTSLGIGGAAGVVVGLIFFFVGSKAAESARFSDLLYVGNGGVYTGDAGATGQGWATFGVIVAILGALMLIALLVIRAAKAENAPADQ